MKKKRTRRLLCVTDTPICGGAEKHLVDMIMRLDMPGIDCTILCYGSDCFSRYLGDRSNVRVIIQRWTKPISFFAYWLTLAKLRPHTIVFINAWLGLFPWYAYLAARLSGARRLLAIEHIIADPALGKITSHGMWNYLRRFLGWRTRYIWRMRLAGILSHKTICVSNAVREMLINEYGYPKSKTMTILNGVDLQYYGSSNSGKCLSKRAMLSLGPSEPIILCISNLTVPKRIDILLEALCIVAKNHPSSKCLILGAGPLEAELRARAIELGLAATVLFVGYVKDVRPYLEIADLFVLSSEKEGLPLSVGEAMAYGLPCIVTDAGGNREIVVHGHTGLVVEPGSPEQLAQAIEYLLVHREERSRMASNAQQRVREHFNMDSKMGELIKVLVGEA